MSVIGLVIQPDERSSKLWRQLFPPDTPVIPFEAPDDLASRPVMTFSGSTVIDSLRRSYTQTALDAVDDLPVIAPPAPGLAAGDEPPFADFFAAVGDPANQFLLTADDQTFATTMASLVAGAGRGDAGMVEVLPGGQGSTGEIVRTMAFHRGPGTVTEPETDDEQRREAVHESIDFHRMLTGLNEHPTMLRRLGLVFDIAVEIRSTGTQTGRARFQPSWTPQLTATTDRPLWVAWRLDLAATQPFAAATAGPPGVLDVGAASAYRIEALALDSAALHVVAMAATTPAGGAADRAPGAAQRRPAAAPRRTRRNSSRRPQRGSRGHAGRHARRPAARRRPRARIPVRRPRHRPRRVVQPARAADRLPPRRHLGDRAGERGGSSPPNRHQSPGRARHRAGGRFRRVHPRGGRALGRVEPLGAATGPQPGSEHHGG